MPDLSPLIELDTRLRRSRKMLPQLLHEANELEGADKARRSTFLKQASDREAIRTMRFDVDHAIADRSDAYLVAECLDKELLPRVANNLSLPVKTYLIDILDLLSEGQMPSCLAVLRGMRSLGQNVRFLPPAQHVVNAIRAQDADLHSHLGEVIKLQSLL